MSVSRIVRTSSGISVPEEKLRLLKRNIKRTKHTMIFGPTGSGKTTLALWVAQESGRPVEVFPWSAVFDPEAAIIGSLKLEEGETRFHRSRFIDAITTPGCVILLDEMNRAPGPASNALMSVTDHQGRIAVDLDRGAQRVVARAEGVVVLATSNIGAEYTGTEMLDQALMNRFLHVRLGYPDDEQALLVERGVPAAQAAWAVRVAVEMRKARQRGQLSTALSTRGLIEVGEMLLDGFAMEDSVECLAGPIDEAELTAIRAIVRTTR
jgi:nitric oxide reductase NorQ protein